MSTVDITPNGSGGYRILVDGVDISAVVRVNGIAVGWNDNRPQVYVVLQPTELRARLDPAIVEVVDALPAVRNFVPPEDFGTWYARQVRIHGGRFPQ